MFLINPFRGRMDEEVGAPRRVRTLSALHRILDEAFALRRSCECSCKLPVVFKRDDAAPDEPNWQVETLWCGCHDCQKSLREVVAIHAPLFQVKESAEPEDR